MKNDVKTLISALTSERNAIDRAIVGLQQMSDVRDGVTKTAPVVEGKARQARKTRLWLSGDAKSAMYLRMQAAEHRGHEARRLSREFGAAAVTIYTTWRKWAPVNGNGHDIQDPVVPQPESNASAIGVQ